MMKRKNEASFDKEKFELIFHNLPVAIWEEDLSAVVKLRDYLKDKSITNIRNYLARNPDLVKKTFSGVKIVDVNRAALQLYGARTKKELISNLGKSFNKGALEVLTDEFASLIEGKLTFSAEFKSRTLSGKTCDVLLSLSVPKPYKDTLSRVIVTLQDISERKRLERRLLEKAQIDGLTKLLNHNAIIMRLNEEIARARRYHLSFACFMIDLDHFKLINDKFGHQGGDQILKRVAALIKNSLRSVDVVGRYGGDEFLVILPETSSENAKTAALRIQTIFHEKSIRYKNQKNLKMTLSIGVCGYPDKNVKEAKDIISKADKAMYKAKQSGRNRSVSVF